MRTLLGLFAAAIAATAVSAAQTNSAAKAPADPSMLTVSGCVKKTPEGAFTLTNARRVSGATGAAASSATWTIDIMPLVAGILDMDRRVGQRVELVGRIGAPPDDPPADAKTPATPALPRLQLQSVKPLRAATPCPS